MGGWSRRFERGFRSRRFAESAYRFQQAVERKEKVIVGVNEFVQRTNRRSRTLYIDESAGDTQLAKLERLRRTRDSGSRRADVGRLRSTAATQGNLMPLDSRCGSCISTIGEMCDVLREGGASTRNARHLNCRFQDCRL